MIENIERALDRAVRIQFGQLKNSAKQIYKSEMLKLRMKMLEETGFDVQYELREDEYREVCFPAAIFYMDRLNFYIDLRHDL